MEKTKVLAFCSDFIPSFELGVRYPLQHLEKRDYIETRFLRSCDVRNNDLHWCDVVVAVRSCGSVELEILRTSKQMGKYACYYMDDDLLNIPAALKGNEVLRQQKTIQRIRLIMGYCDCFWTSNKLLADKYGYIFTKAAIIDAPAMLLGLKPNCTDKNSNSQLCIGYSGNFTHAPLIDKLLSEPLLKLQKAMGDQVIFEFFGPKPEVMKKLKNCNHISHVSSYEEYTSVMLARKWDIALAPLEYGEFSACKYFNKFVEYGSVGIPCVFSNVPPFTLVVEDKHNGILCENDCESWFTALKELAESDELRKSIAINAMDYLTKHNTVEAISEEIIAEIPDIISYKTPPSMPQRLRRKNIVKYRRLRSQYAKFMDILSQYGVLKGGLMIFKKICKKLLRHLSIY